MFSYKIFFLFIKLFIFYDEWDSFFGFVDKIMGLLVIVFGLIFIYICMMLWIIMRIWGLYDIFGMY